MTRMVATKWGLESGNSDEATKQYSDTEIVVIFPASRSYEFKQVKYALILCVCSHGTVRICWINAYGMGREKKREKITRFICIFPLSMLFTSYFTS